MSSEVTVSVAVIYKRDLSDPVNSPSERILSATLPLPMPTPPAWNAELVLRVSGVPENKLARPGQWIMLAGRLAASPNYQYSYWYRVLSADKAAPADGTYGYQHQFITVSGRDWPASLISTPSVWVIDNVIAVYEKKMRLEIP